MLFSAAQLHSTVPNSSGLTRYSIDFRTVHLDDVWNKRGALNIDSACSGTTLWGLHSRHRFYAPPRGRGRVVF